MSSSSVAIALNHSRATGAARLVLVGIAEHDGDGGSWPAVSTLARYAGGVDRSTVQRAIATLEGLGEIRREINGGGSHSTAEYQRPNLYRFLLTCPADCDGSTQHRTARSRTILEPLDGTESDPAAPTRRGSVHAARGAASTRRPPAAPTRPEPSFRTTHELESPSATIVAREIDPCPNSAAGHSYPSDDEAARCARCGMDRTQVYDPTTHQITRREDRMTA